MNPENIRLVQDSFAQVAPIADQAAELFYGRLFEVAPQVKPLFKGDMRKQGAMLMQTIGLAVKSLNDLSTIEPALRKMGQRHVGYGAQPAHYAVVGDCLLWTLQQRLGEAFTPEVKAAWAETYQTLADVMIEEYQASAAA